MNVYNYQVTKNYIKYEPVRLTYLQKKYKNVFLNQSTISQVFIKNLEANRSYLNEVKDEKNAQPNECLVKNDLMVDGDLVINHCKLKLVKEKLGLRNYCQVDAITAKDDIKLINENVEKIFIRSVDAQKSANIRNMHIGELTFRSGHTIIDNCHISTIRIKKIKKEQTECVLEFKGISTVGKIISEGVDIEIKGRELFAR